jgi:hypothetical protein
MKVEIRECLTKVSPKCTNTFERVAQRGRPPVSCVPCREMKAAPAKPRTTAANPINPETLERICGCGQTFKVGTGRGRKAEKCDECRTAGVVYRRNDDGTLEAIRADQIKREEDERKTAAGQQRALLLHLDMQKLFRKRGLVAVGH